MCLKQFITQKVKDTIYLVSRLKKYIHKYSWRIRSNNILHPRSLKLFYIEDICKSFHEERFLHHLRKLHARILGDWL
ncbi:hypothetical protein GIB67_036293 [Kingdonia uniflora]|uniref:Uncharacterized protein n=1 Tax=Kingdonia uniflora TaxID=39325 RepID=A0A7J7L3Q7_9MAGN|nr:hypothetical protein GIB67_036293 [Kingdonia uniflora]